MADITEYEIEQVLFKLKANKNSKELQRQGKKLDLLEKDPEVKALDEFIMQLKRGELIVDIPDEQKLEDFTSTDVELPELGRLKIYEPSKVSNQRKIEAEKEAIKEENKSASEIEIDKEQKTELAKYSVISLKDEDGKPFDLVIDIDGNDVGKIIYDEKGKPSFEMAPELKQKIDADLDRTNVRSFVEDQTLQEEFYLKDIGALERAIKEGKVVPESVKATGERAIAAKRIKDEAYFKEDIDKALILTSEEKRNEKQIQEEAEERVRNNFSSTHLQTTEQERNLTQEQIEKLKADEISNKNIQPQQVNKNNPENQEEKENDSVIPENVKDKVEACCEKNKIDLKNITAVLIILDTKTLNEATENSKIEPYGDDVIMIQYSDAVGKPKYIPIQNEADLTNVANDESFEHLIEPLHRTTGIVKRLEDEKIYIDYNNSQGEIQSIELKRVPENNMSIQEKELFKEKIEKDLANLEMVRVRDPENITLIYQMGEKVLKDFEEIGLIPPEDIKQDVHFDAQEKVNEEDEENSKTQNDDDDCYDEIGRRIRPK
ncbi:MAG: hypothetical protein J6J60_07640 [Clostridia bacterium]|nr:hypothetical protein [Clostridia bacterium]